MLGKRGLELFAIRMSIESAPTYSDFVTFQQSSTVTVPRRCLDLIDLRSSLQTSNVDGMENSTKDDSDFWLKQRYASK